MTRSILACFAHPDDESFSVGGTLAHYASLGIQTTLVCTTRGEAGKIADPALATQRTWARYGSGVEVRSGRARASMRSRSSATVDSGMEGAEDNNHPLAYVMADRDEVIAKLVGYIRKPAAGGRHHVRPRRRLRSPGPHRNPPPHRRRGGRCPGRDPLPRGGAGLGAPAAVLHRDLQNEVCRDAREAGGDGGGHQRLRP